jgi:hypothetical protein
LIGLVGQTETDGVAVANSAFPETIREGDGNGLVLAKDKDPRFAMMT